MTSRILIGAAAIGVLLFFLWPRTLDRVPPRRVDTVPAGTSVAAGQEGELTTDSERQSGRVTDGTALPEPRAAEASDDSSPTPPVESLSAPLDREFSIVDWRERIQQEILAASPEQIGDRRRRAAAREPESAFWLSELYRLCLSFPRTEGALDRRIAQIDEALDMALRDRPNTDPRLAEEALNRSVKAFEVCSQIDPNEEIDLAALEWLELAADLGHRGAQRLYHAHARELLLGELWPHGRQLAFMYPTLVEEFKLRADRYARALTAAEEPQALLLMARMMFFGDVYEKDLVKAYAYATAAKLEGDAGLQSAANAWIGRLKTMLSEAEIAAAEDMAVDLAR